MSQCYTQFLLPVNTQFQDAFTVNIEVNYSAHLAGWLPNSVTSEWQLERILCQELGKKPDSAVNLENLRDFLCVFFFRSKFFSSVKWEGWIQWFSSFLPALKLCENDLQRPFIIAYMTDSRPKAGCLLTIRLLSLLVQQTLFSCLCSFSCAVLNNFHLILACSISNVWCVFVTSEKKILNRSCFSSF